MLLIHHLCTSDLQHKFLPQIRACVQLRLLRFCIVVCFLHCARTSCVNAAGALYAGLTMQNVNYWRIAACAVWFQRDSLPGRLNPLTLLASLSSRRHIDVIASRRLLSSGRLVVVEWMNP